jgi:glycosyltransferase involved in cell wall biosynthesis
MTTSNPAVSVVVPVYNQERFIGRCLRSLLYQTPFSKDYEIIVVDDGSTDKTPYALELFFDAIRTITNPENLGLPTALNQAIEVARAPYVVRVDSDDYVNANFLNFLFAYLDQNQTVDAVACDYWLVDDQENWLERTNCMEKPIGCGIMFRKAQLIEIGLFDEGFRIHEDKDLRIRFEQNHVIDHLSIPLYRYRRHDSNLTNDKRAVESHQKNLVKKHGGKYIEENCT